MDRTTADRLRDELQFRLEDSGLDLAPEFALRDPIRNPLAYFARLDATLADGAKGPLLTWSKSVAVEAVNTRDPCLHKFIDLRNGTPEQIARFARRWGPLGLCHHRLPWWHKVSSGHPCEGAVGAMDANSAVLLESVQDWIDIASSFWAALSIAASLRADETPSDADWRAFARTPLGHLSAPLRFRFLAVGPLATSARPSEEVLALQDYAARWLDASGAALTVYRTDNPPALLAGVMVPGLAAKLAVELVGALTSTKGVYHCNACSRPYVREGRKPRRGLSPSGRPLRQLCPTCGKDDRYRSVKRDGQREARRVRPVTRNDNS